MHTQFFWGMAFFGALVGGFVGGYNFRRPLKGDSNREQKSVGRRMVIGMVIGTLVGGAIGFFVR